MDDAKYVIEKMELKYWMPVTVTDENFHILSGGKMFFRSDRFFEENKDLWMLLTERSSRQQYPVLLVEKGNWGYAVVRDDKHGRNYILGPVSLGEVPRREIWSYRGISQFVSDQRFWQGVGYEQLENSICILYFAIHQCQLKEERFLEENGIDRKKLRVSDDEKMMYQINCSEKNRNYTSLETEQAWLNAVKRGDLSFVEEGELNWKVTGEMAKSSLKQLEYGCVCMITLLTRAAMEAGVPAVEAYNISDMYLQKLEKCVAQSEINVLIHNAYEAFQERIVREQERLEIPYYITTCKDYIAQHRTRDIHVSDLVKAVGVSHSYLSKKFKEFEGITLREYMLQEKINAAANMIRYSDRSLSEIAEYLNFSSQSHMGQCFRKKFDMTPQEYRRKYREI